MAFCLELRHLFKRLSCSDVLLGMGVLLVELYLSLRFASHHTPAQVFVFVTFCAIALADSCFVKHLVKSERLDRKTLAIFIGLSVVVGVLLEGLTVLGSPASYFANLHDWNKRRLVVFAFAAFFVIQAGFLKKDAVNAAWLALKRDSSKRCKAMMIAVTVVAICLVVTFRVGAAQPLFFDAIAGLIVLSAIVFFARGLLALPAGFFLVAFASGSMLIYGVPITTGISWDDQIHYANALNASYLFESQMTSTDWSFSVEAIERAQGKDAPDIESFDVNAISERASKLDASYERDEAQGRTIVDKHKESIYTINEVGYIPFAVGLWIGRLLHFGFSSTVLFAKLCNLISYAFVVACAISVAPSKKTVFAFVGLMPTSLFLAANFSYDTWLISFTMLGFAFYLRYAWGSKSEFSILNIAACYVFTFVGLAVKAVYFPLIGIYLLVPRDRFSSSRQRLLYYALVILFGVYTLASFALPFLFSAGAGAGDVRGGAGVDSAGQISFILQNPVRYSGILLTFLFKDLLSPMNSHLLACNFAYLRSLGQALASTCVGEFLCCAPALSFAALGMFAGDETGAEHVCIWGSIWSFLMCLFSLVLVATALYVSFTPVGLATVNGCQTRYVIPVLVPALAVGLNNKIFRIGEKTNLIVLFLLVAIFFFTLSFAVLIFPRFL